MAMLAHEMKASYAFIERNFYLTKRYWGWEIAFLIYSVAGALSVSLIGADVCNARILLISGVYYSVDILPGWMQVASRLSPATYVLDAVRRGLIDGAGIGELLRDVWPLVVMGIVLIPAGLWLFGKAERYAKRTGKLKRVG